LWKRRKTSTSLDQLLLPLPPGEGWGEGVCQIAQLYVRPHPNPLPGGEGTRAGREQTGIGFCFLIGFMLSVASSSCPARRWRCEYRTRPSTSSCSWGAYFFCSRPLQAGALRSDVHHGFTHTSIAKTSPIPLASTWPSTNRALVFVPFIWRNRMPWGLEYCA
jgi:hypothetical protein